MEPLISVIVPIYKVEKYLNRCVDSILNQTYKNLEVILVDDGSPDNCPRICDEYAKQDKRIKVIHKQNGGLMAAWIDGVQKCSAEYVAFVDSDDWIEPYAFKDYVEVIKKYSPDMIVNNYFITGDEFRYIRTYEYYELNRLLEDEELSACKNEILFNEKRYFGFYRWNKIFKKECIINNLAYCDTRVSCFEDINISLAGILDANSIYMMNKPSYNYYVRSDSMIKSSFNPNLIANHEYFLTAYQQLLVDKKQDYVQLTLIQNFKLVYDLLERIFKTKGRKKEFLDKLNKSALLNNDNLLKNMTRLTKPRQLVIKLMKAKCYLILKFLYFIKRKQVEKLDRKFIENNAV